ncbi:MAG: hypothetical protein IH608_08575, partial [Proteobacteria bacterium]|nr:hypothetical protein [Pseudomonadota bacterium]
MGSAAEVEGRLGWTQGLSLRAEGRALDYDLRRFMSFLNPEPFPVGVRAGGTFRAQGTLLPELSLDCDVELQAQDLDVTVGEGAAGDTVFAVPKARLSSRLNVGTHEIRFGTTRIETPSVAVDIPSGRILYKEGLWLDTKVTLQSLEHVRQYLPAGLDARGTADGTLGGPYRELVFAYDLDLASAVVFGEDLGRLRATARYDLHDLVLDRAVLAGPFGRLAAEGSVGLHREGTYSLQIEATVPALEAVAQAVRRSVPGVPADLGGAAAASGRLTGPLASPVFAGELKMDRPAALGYALDEIALRGEASAEGWRIAEGTARAYGAPFEARGEGDTRALQVSGTISGLHPERIAAAGGRELPVTAEFSGSFEVGGEYGNPRAELTGTAEEVVVAGRAVGSVTATVQYRGRLLDAQVAALEGAVRVRGELGLGNGFPFTADVELAELPWSALAGEGVPPELTGEAVSGRGQVGGALSGDQQGIQASWTGAARGVRWG